MVIFRQFDRAEYAKVVTPVQMFLLFQPLPLRIALLGSAGKTAVVCSLAMCMHFFAGLFLSQVNIYIRLTVWFQEEFCSHGMGELFCDRTLQHDVGMRKNGAKLC